ncbi:alkaline phosphatase family protein [Clostridia bacterium]|nr:alkaline phosphatase family protein [Clostridia bacterium]
MNFKKYVWPMASFVLAALLVVSLFYKVGEDEYRPRVEIMGDVNQTITFSNLDEIDPEYQDQVSLASLLEVCEPWEDDYSVLLIGADGLVAQIDERLEETWLQFSTANGWEIRDDVHPVSAQIKHLSQIVVVATSDTSLLSIGVDTRSGELLRTTPGNLVLQGLKRHLNWEGSSNIDRESGTYGVDIYTSLWTLPMDSILNTESRLHISGRDGSVHLHQGTGELSLVGNRIDYLDGEYVVEDIAGILVDAPAASVADAYDEALYYIRHGEPVMLLFLDGFSYEQYAYAKEQGLIPYLSEKPVAKEALSFYKPVTNVGFAAMISGQGPDMNGIHDRSDRLLEHSIFRVLADEGKKALLLEGDVRILDAGAEEKLHVDLNDNGFLDDEIFESAHEAVNSSYDYLLVHFHEIDDAGHSYGPFGEETLEQIALHDKFVEELANNFEGKVIVVADHGMHETEDGGTHGQVRWSDMVVPYLVMDGGK